MASKLMSCFFYSVLLCSALYGCLTLYSLSSLYYPNQCFEEDCHPVGPLWKPSNHEKAHFYLTMTCNYELQPNLKVDEMEKREIKETDESPSYVINSTVGLTEINAKEINHIKLSPSELKCPTNSNLNPNRNLPLLQADITLVFNNRKIQRVIGLTETRNNQVLLKTKVHIQYVYDQTLYPMTGIPDDVKPFLKITSQKKMKYHPIVYPTELGLMRKHYVPFNSTTPEYTVDVTFEVISLGWWRFARGLEGSIVLIDKLLQGSEKEIDDMRHIFTETEPILLGVTLLVSFIHMTFDILAFGDDIAFWNSRGEGFKGLSPTSLIFSLVSHIIITLYLYDNGTSYLVLSTSAFSVLLTIWKLGKIYSVRVTRNGWKILIYVGSLSTEDFHLSSLDFYVTKKLSMILFPILIAYSVYSWIQTPPSNLYSWLISTLASCVYLFGFITMTPQLYLNYINKTVPELPWRALTYRALNTIVDDFFALIVPMPTMHRLSCFRDDIIFFIYLYQRYIYPTAKGTIETDQKTKESKKNE